LANFQPLSTRVLTKPPDILARITDIPTILPDARDLPRQRNLIDMLAFRELLTNTLAHEFGDGRAPLPTHRGQDPCHVIIKV
jgi:hypothetical protein